MKSKGSAIPNKSKVKNGIFYKWFSFYFLEDFVFVFLQLMLINISNSIKIVIMGEGRDSPVDLKDSFSKDQTVKATPYAGPLSHCAAWSAGFPDQAGCQGARLPPMSLLVHGVYTKCCYSRLHEIF